MYLATKLRFYFLISKSFALKMRDFPIFSQSFSRAPPCGFPNCRKWLFIAPKNLQSALEFIIFAIGFRNLIEKTVA